MRKSTRVTFAMRDFDRLKCIHCLMIVETDSLRSISDLHRSRETKQPSAVNPPLARSVSVSGMVSENRHSRTIAEMANLASAALEESQHARASSDASVQKLFNEATRSDLKLMLCPLYSVQMNPILAGLKAGRLGRTAASAVESAPNQLASVAAN
jgi:hypothetical protein